MNELANAKGDIYSDGQRQALDGLVEGANR